MTKLRNACHSHDCRKIKVLHEITDFHFAKYRFHFAKYKFLFRKVQIFVSQSTDFHFAKYRFSFRKVQIFISQNTDFVSFRFAKYNKPLVTACVFSRSNPVLEYFLRALVLTFKMVQEWDKECERVSYERGLI